MTESSAARDAVDLGVVVVDLDRVDPVGVVGSGNARG